jgi:hypothetical protein
MQKKGIVPTPIGGCEACVGRGGGKEKKQQERGNNRNRRTTILGEQEKKQQERGTIEIGASLKGSERASERVCVRGKEQGAIKTKGQGTSCGLRQATGVSGNGDVVPHHSRHLKVIQHGLLALCEHVGEAMLQ